MTQLVRVKESDIHLALVVEDLKAAVAARRAGRSVGSYINLNDLEFVLEQVQKRILENNAYNQ